MLTHVDLGTKSNPPPLPLPGTKTILDVPLRGGPIANRSQQRMTLHKNRGANRHRLIHERWIELERPNNGNEIRVFKRIRDWMQRLLNARPVGM